MSHILKIDEYYNKYRGGGNWRKRVQMTHGDDGDVVYMSEPNHKNDCTYRGYEIRNTDCTGGFQYTVSDRENELDDVIGISYMFNIDKLKDRIDELIDSGKLPDLSKDENGNDVVMYKWLDYFNNEWCKTPCSVLSNNGKTAMIKLLGDGPNGKSNGSQMRVRLSSLVGLED